MRPPIDLPPTKTARGDVAATAASAPAPGKERRSSTGATIGHLAPRGHVGEVEGDDVDAPRGQVLGVAAHERAGLPGPGAVRKHEGQLGRWRSPAGKR